MLWVYRGFFYKCDSKRPTNSIHTLVGGPQSSSFMMFRCLRHSVPWHLSDFCTTVATSLLVVNYGPPDFILSSFHATTGPCTPFVRLPRLLCSWSEDLELSHRQSAWSIVVHWQFPVSAANSKRSCFVNRLSVFSALEIFLMMRYTNQCFTHFLLTSLH